MRYVLVFMLALVPCKAYGSWAAMSLEELFNEAELVVVGELGEVRRKVYASRLLQANYETIYDSANIQVERVLKGHWTRDHVSFNFPNPNQRRHPFRHMLLSYEAGYHGIWFLRRGDTGAYRTLGHPRAFSPMGSLPEVEAVLKAAEEGAPREALRVQVQRLPHNPDFWEARIEGTEQYGIGTSREAALGELVLQQHRRFGVEVQLQDETESENEAAAPSLQEP